MAYSNRINDPAFAKYLADSDRYAKIFSYILATAAVLGFYLYGELSPEMDNPEALYIGMGIGGMFIAIALITNQTKKGAKTWDGKVYDKQVEKKRRRRNAADMDYHMKEYLLFKVIFQSNDGKTHEISAENDDTLHNYYRIGERVRYHGGLRSFEKYDKSKDTIIFCNACASMNEMSGYSSQQVIKLLHFIYAHLRFDICFAISNNGPLNINPGKEKATNFPQSLMRRIMKRTKPGIIAVVVMVFLMSATHFASAKDADVLFPVIKNNLWGYIDSSGKTVVEPRYDHASQFSEGLGLVKTPKPDGKLLCIDAKGKIAFEINPNWSYMKPFNNGLAAVKDKETKLYGYINREGELVIPHKYSAAGDFSEGLAKVELKDSQNKLIEGFIDTKGEMVIRPDRWLKNSFSDGLAAVRTEKDGKFVYGFMDKKGKTVIEPRFKKVGRFGEGLAFVNDNGQIRIIDKKGKSTAIFNFKTGDFDKMPKFSNGFANLYYNWKFPTGFWGFVDKNGKLAFPQLDITFIKTPFSEERAWIKLRGSKDMV